MDHKGDRVANWKFFKASWNNYVVATELNKKDKSIQVSTLLTVMGKDCYQVYENLPLTDVQRQDPDTILLQHDKHYEPQRNTIYERYLFNMCR